MSTTHLDAPTTDAIDVPTDLHSSETKLVYLCLAVRNGATVDELHEALDIRKISLFPVLRTLTDRDVVARDGATYVPNAS